MKLYIFNNDQNIHRYLRFVVYSSSVSSSLVSTTSTSSSVSTTFVSTTSTSSSGSTTFVSTTSPSSSVSTTFVSTTTGSDSSSVSTSTRASSSSYTVLVTFNPNIPRIKPSPETSIIAPTMEASSIFLATSVPAFLFPDIRMLLAVVCIFLMPLDTKLSSELPTRARACSTTSSPVSTIFSATWAREKLAK